MQTFFDKLNPRRSVLKRTRGRPDLPALVIYIENIGGQAKRKVLDEQGGEHLIDDSLLQSQYKLVTGAQGKELVTKHWPHLKEASKPGA